MDSIWQLYGWRDEFVVGFFLTLQVSSVAYLFSICFGLLGASAKASDQPINRFLGNTYTTVVRSLPELLIILLLYFSIATGLENILKSLNWVASDFQFSPFWAAVVALAFINGAFMTEVFRASLNAVEKGQIEAAHSIGMSNAKTFQRIIFPQMLRHAVPGMGNLWLSITKESAIISVLGSFSELLYTGYRAAAATREYVFFYSITAFLFLFITIVSVWILKLIENRLNRGYK